MAGAGYKLFSTGDVLTASDLNTYGIEQTVMVFADSSARDTALTSVKAEGMFAFLKDSDSLTYYSGAAWIAVDLAGDITGITTAAASGLSGGASSGTVTLTLNLAGLTAAQNFGADGAGVDVTLHSDTAGDYAMWDSSEEKLILEGTNAATVLDVTDGNVSIGDGTLAVSGTLTVGSDGSGADVTFHSATASDNFLWDASDEKLVITGTDGTNALEVADGDVEITDTLTVTGTSALNVTGFSNSVVSEAQMKDYAETVNAIGSKSAAFNIDFEDGNVQTVTISSGTFNVGLTNSLASHSNSVTILGTNLGAGTPSFVAGAHGGGGNAVVWAGGTAPTYTASGTDVLCFTTFDGGTTFYGFAAGLDFS